MLLSLSELRPWNLYVHLYGSKPTFEEKKFSECGEEEFSKFKVNNFR